MALHLDYEFRAPAAWSGAEARRVVAELRRCALDLHCIHVSELFEYTAAAAQPVVEFDAFGTPQAARFGRMVRQLTEVPSALREIERRSRQVEPKFSRGPDPEERRKLRELGAVMYEDVRHLLATVMPKQAYVFDVVFGEGAETLPIGLGRYPARLGGHPTRPGKDWWWEEMKTLQYAGNGGDDNVLRCFRSAMALFDRARELGLTVLVRDDTGYAESRDEAELLACVRRANALTAAVAGAFKDSLTAENQLQAPILHHPEFEHLEAEGRKEWESRSEPATGEETG